MAPRPATLRFGARAARRPRAAALSWAFLAALLALPAAAQSPEPSAERQARLREIAERAAAREALNSARRRNYGGGDEALEQEVWRALRAPSGGPEPVQEEISARLAGLGPRAIPLYFGILCGELTEPLEGEYPPKWDRAADSAGGALPRQDQVLLEALRRMPPKPMLDELFRLATGDAPVDVRLIAARVLAEVSDERSVEVLLDVAAGIEPIHLMRTYVQGPIEDAARRILARCPSAWRTLERRCDGLDPALLAVLVRALPLERGPEGLRFLPRTFGRDPDLDLLAVKRMGELAGACEGWEEEEGLSRLRSFLDHREWAMRREAAVALGALEDFESCPALIALLDDEDRRVQRSASWSLQRLSGESLGLEAERWQSWYEGERIWLEKEEPRLAAQLEGSAPGPIFDALSQLSRRRAFRHRAAARAGPLVLHANPSISRAACAALAALRSARGVPFLVQGLRSPDEETRQTCWKALRELTGKDLPAEAEAWEAELGS